MHHSPRQRHQTQAFVDSLPETDIRLRAVALAELGGPLLFVQGEKDGFLSNQAKLLDLIPGSRRITLPGCGTFMFYDRGPTWARVISEFLELG